MSSDAAPPKPAPEAATAGPEPVKPVVVPEPEEPAPPAPAVGPGVVTPPPSAPGSPARKATKKAITEADKKAEYVSATVRSILLWENPINSAAALSGILATIYILSHYSPLRIISFVLAAAIGANLVIVNVWVHAHRLLTNVEKDGVKKAPTTWYLDQANRNILSAEKLHAWSDLFADLVNVSFGAIASLIAIDNNARSFEALVGALALYWLSGVLSGWTLLTTLVILSFVAPPIYIANKGLIDEQVGHAQAVASTQIQQADNKFKSFLGKAKSKVKKSE
ncbi:hypothetical protein HDV00_007885 [Rhizophlyctis rosea]|nr:hypothetical protein HDV00_007885 [Rhizophlyctis rosea]